MRIVTVEFAVPPVDNPRAITVDDNSVLATVKAESSCWITTAKEFDEAAVSTDRTLDYPVIFVDFNAPFENLNLELAPGSTIFVRSGASASAIRVVLFFKNPAEL